LTFPGSTLLAGVALVRAQRETDHVLVERLAVDARRQQLDGRRATPVGLLPEVRLDRPAGVDAGEGLLGAEDHTRGPFPLGLDGILGAACQGRSTDAVLHAEVRGAGELEPAVALDPVGRHHVGEGVEVPTHRGVLGGEVGEERPVGRGGRAVARPRAGGVAVGVDAEDAVVTGLDGGGEHVGETVVVRDPRQLALGAPDDRRAIRGQVLEDGRDVVGPGVRHEDRGRAEPLPAVDVVHAVVVRLVEPTTRGEGDVVPVRADDGSPALPRTRLPVERGAEELERPVAVEQVDVGRVVQVPTVAGQVGGGLERQLVAIGADAR
jgi:hypothetical protein